MDHAKSVELERRTVAFLQGKLPREDTAETMVDLLLDSAPQVGEIRIEWQHQGYRPTPIELTLGGCRSDLLGMGLRLDALCDRLALLIAEQSAQPFNRNRGSALVPALRKEAQAGAACIDFERYGRPFLHVTAVQRLPPQRR